MPKILAVIDPEHTEHLALTRIKELPAEGFVFQIEFFMPKRSMHRMPPASPKKWVRLAMHSTFSLSR